MDGCKPQLLELQWQSTGIHCIRGYIYLIVANQLPCRESNLDTPNDQPYLAIVFMKATLIPLKQYFETRTTNKYCRPESVRVVRQLPAEFATWRLSNGLENSDSPLRYAAWSLCLCECCVCMFLYRIYDGIGHI
jgi:hypothetical protein